jgi:hypothetical protein
MSSKFKGDRQMLKKFLTTYTLHLSIVVVALGIFFTILGLFGVFYSYLAPDFIENLLEYIKDWTLWCVLVGPLMVLIGGLYLGDNISKRREFDELIETTSKAKFIRNLDQIEYLAWRLTPKHQSLVVEKKEEFKIK